LKSLSPHHIATLRNRNYRRTQSLRVQTIQAAERFVNQVGFCFFWPIKGVEMPNLFHAIAGRIRDVPMEHDDPDISKCWGWKDRSLGQRRWYYAKLLSKKATLISLEYLPWFYALSPNYGGDEDYLEEYAAGHLSREAKVIYEALRQGGALDTVRLRRESRLSADSAKTTFERALVELQVGMKIVPVGVAEAGAWRYAFIYDLVTRHFPDLLARSQLITRAQARAALLERHVANVVVADRSAIARVFGALKWTAHELDKTLTSLCESGRLMQVGVAGAPGEHFALPRTLGR
jgi:hypothetical protein